MHRRFSSLVKSSKRSTSSAHHYEPPTMIPAPPGAVPGGSHHDPWSAFPGYADSDASTIGPDEPLPPASLKIKRVDYYFSSWGKIWKYKDMNSKVKVETMPVLVDRKNDPWKEYSFVLVRTLPQGGRQPTFKIVIKSAYILKACKDVIQTWPGLSWNMYPLELQPEIFLTWYDKFIQYRDGLAAAKARTEQETNVLNSVNVLLNFLSTDFHSTLTQIEHLTSHGEITFELLYAILVPRTLVVARCAITGQERIFVLQSFTRNAVENMPVYSLELESVDLTYRPMSQNSGPGHVSTHMYISRFSGIVRIDSLDVYPLKFHSAEAHLREAVAERGRKWAALAGVHHRQYSGIAAYKVQGHVVRQQVDSRIMVDRSTFQRTQPSYPFPIPVPLKTENGFAAHPGWGAAPVPAWSDDGHGAPLPAASFVNTDLVNSQASDTPEVIELSEDELLLTPTVVYGFSLNDKNWWEFDVTKVQPVAWHSDAFANLVLPGNRKTLLKSLVEAHYEGGGMDDFIPGKGVGLVVNLYGPPGVGKTFSAEATSEHVQRPLYVIGGGDLGARAADVDSALAGAFGIATAWKAIILIDEADVFLERRSLHDLERNAMVAVFLRHVEYYRGILFLTTNRVQSFDEAFLSRIHLALHFSELSEASRAQVWRAFVSRVKMTPSSSSESALASASTISEDQIALLAKRPINGRQIKNAMRTAHSLALGRKEPVGFGHLLETLDAMDEFTAQFRGEQI